MGEFELIRHYFAAATCARSGGEVLLGIGDDCALLALPAGEVLAVSTDTLVETVHFPGGCDPELLAQRALGVSASDLAAMGATPIGFTLALTLPEARPSWLEAFSRGLDAMAARCAMRLLGGDTTRGPLSLTLTVFGRLPRGAALTRSGARPGDLLCVGGPLGDGAGALALVLGQRQAPPSVADALLARYWAPRPQLELGQALRGRASAALDISDGLLGDCGHIATASGVALRIESERIPLSAPLLQLLGHEQALAAALAGGDDYLLAFTLPPDQLPSLQAQGWPVHPIGTVEAGSGVRLVDSAGAPVAFADQGYRHFSS
ncbi:thiamine-phosphate kinase [Stutzerimonas nosocomialis]|uniref:thiamine-phosphate kinase n=1 Tax=Stutzerimonas nosocomialis TaxID=1056496 RepID=UPI001108AB00|nr:thiamine-phosphate kinase [Stutzerimonas nosocomialis]TLX56997.1 thiamine-phosphate kinase [Stutzerimonas nosocomialis]